MELLWDGLLEALRLLLKRDPLVMDAAARSLWFSSTAVLLAGIFGVFIGTGLARIRFPGRGVCVLLFRGGMALPTVLIGLVCYAMFSRRGPLGPLDLLYSPWGVVAGEFVLALPIIVTLVHGAVANLDPRVTETARTLGAGKLRRCLSYLSEARIAVVLALLTAFARCVTELGIAMMVGGNLKYRTRTLTTATALESATGEFARGIAMSLVLLLIATIVTVAISSLGRSEGDLAK